MPKAQLQQWYLPLIKVDLQYRTYNNPYQVLFQVQGESYRFDVAEYVDRIIVMNKGAVMYDDVPKEVFKHHTELEEIGLSAPQVKYIMQALHQKGLPVSTDATTIDEATEEPSQDFEPDEGSEVLEAVKKLPEKYRLPIHLFYYEGYSINDIAGIIGKKPATVGTLLARARERLKEILKGGNSN